MEKYLTVKDVMEIFQVSRSTVYWWIKKGKLKGFRPSALKEGAIRFRIEDIEDMRASGSRV